MAEAKAFAAGTIVNALACFKGVAFALNLKTRVKILPNRDLELSEKGTKCVAVRIFRSLGIEAGIEVKSEIPKRSGLGSSSAFVNALICAAYKYAKKELDAYSILRSNARLSLECGISYTGAFDDASASLLGGIVFSNNAKMKLYDRRKINSDAVVLLPEWERKKIDLKEIRSRKEEIERAFKLALEGKLREAMYLNSYEYCRVLKLPFEPVAAAYNLGLCAGLSGNGPSYVAFGEGVNDIKSVWESFGKVIRTEIVNEPAENVVIKNTLFIRT